MLPFSTVLHFVASSDLGVVPKLEYLLNTTGDGYAFAEGIDVSATTSEGDTAEQLAHRQRKPEAVAVLQAEVGLMHPGACSRTPRHDVMW